MGDKRLLGITVVAVIDILLGSILLIAGIAETIYLASHPKSYFEGDAGMISFAVITGFAIIILGISTLKLYVYSRIFNIIFAIVGAFFCLGSILIGHGVGLGSVIVLSLLFIYFLRTIFYLKRYDVWKQFERKQ